MNTTEVLAITRGYDLRYSWKRVTRFTSRRWSKWMYRHYCSEDALKREIQKAARKKRTYILLECFGGPSLQGEMRKHTARHVFAPKGFKLVVKTFTEAPIGNFGRETNHYLIGLSWGET